MPYDLKFSVAVPGKDELNSVPGIVEKLAKSTQATSSELRIFEAVLKADVAAGSSLAEALKRIASTSQGGYEGLSKLAKEALNVQKASDDTEKALRKEEQAWRRLAAAQDAARKEEERRNKPDNTAANGLLRLGQATGLVGGQTAAIARTGETLGISGIITPANLAAAAIAAIGVEAAKASYELVRDMAAAERETQNLADRLGITLQEAEKLSSAARLAGVSVGSLEGASRGLAEALENPTTSGKKTADALHKIGIETIGLQGPIKEIGPIFTQVLEKLAQIPEQAKRFALAQELLPRGAANALKPLIQDYAELQKIVERLHIGEDALGSKELLDADRQIKELSDAWGQFKKELAIAIDPIIIPVVRSITDILSSSNDTHTAKTSIEGVHSTPNGRRDVMSYLLGQSQQFDEGTSGTAFRNQYDRTKEGLESQLQAAKKAAADLVPSLSSDTLGSTKRAEDLAEYDKQEASVKRLEAAIESLNKAKHAPEAQAQADATLKADAANAEAKELFGEQKINAEIDARKTKLAEELNLKHGIVDLTEKELGYFERIRKAETDRYNQQVAVTRAQDQRATANTAIDQARRLIHAQTAGAAEITLAQGRGDLSDDSIHATYQTRLQGANEAFQDAARQVTELRKQRDEFAQLHPGDTLGLQKLNTGISEFQIKAGGDAAVAVYDAQKQRVLELIALDKKRFEDQASEAKNARTIIDAGTKADFEDRKAELSRQSKLIGVNADTEVSGFQKQMDLRRQAAQLDRDERTKTITAQLAEQATLSKAPGADQKQIEQEVARLRADEISNQRSYERELGEERIEIELKIAEIRKKGEEEYKQFVVGLVNSALTGKHATTDYLREFGKKEFDQIVSNVAGLTVGAFRHLIPPIPGQTDSEGNPTFLGKVFGNVDVLGNPAGGLNRARQQAIKAQAIERGNALGRRPEYHTQDPQNVKSQELVKSIGEETTSVVANTEATDRNTRALEDANRIARGVGGEKCPIAALGRSVDNLRRDLGTGGAAGTHPYWRYARNPQGSEYVPLTNLPPIDSSASMSLKSNIDAVPPGVRRAISWIEQDAARSPAGSFGSDFTGSSWLVNPPDSKASALTQAALAASMLAPAKAVDALVNPVLGKAAAVGEALRAGDFGSERGSISGRPTGSAGLTSIPKEEWPQFIQDLKLPPAWTDVRVATDPAADLLAIGKDAKGRSQYIYSEAFQTQQSAAKFERIRQLDALDVNAKAAIADTNPVQAEHGEALYIVQKLGIRPGSEINTLAEKQAYGATTLEGRHVVSDDLGVRLQFVGKKGVDLDLPVKDPTAIDILMRRKAEAGDTGQLFPNVSAASLRDFTHDIYGDVKVKDFRTYLGTSMARDLVGDMPVPENQKAFNKALKLVATQVSDVLGNTPAVAAKSYIDPAVFDAWRASLPRVGSGAGAAAGATGIVAGSQFLQAEPSSNSPDLGSGGPSNSHPYWQYYRAPSDSDGITAPSNSVPGAQTNIISDAPQGGGGPSAAGIINNSVSALPQLEQALSTNQGGILDTLSAVGSGNIPQPGEAVERPSIFPESPNYSPLPSANTSSNTAAQDKAAALAGAKPASNLPSGILNRGASVARSLTGLGGFISGAGSATGDLQGIFTGVGTGPGGVGAQSYSTSERIGGAIGTAGIVAGGVFGAIKGFQQGGPRGDLQGAGSILGTVAALDPDPFSKSIIGGLAAITGIISALLPDPRAQREKQITHELASSQYLAPEAINISQDESGHYTDTDAQGNVRTSNFSSTPQVSEPYLYFHGPTYVAAVPGNITAPYGGAANGSTNAQPTTQNTIYNAPVYNGPTTTNNGHTVNAIDMQSFSDMVASVPDAVGSAAAAHLKSGDNALAQQVRYLTSG